MGEKILILTDDNGSVREMAGEIAAIVGGDGAYSVQTVLAGDFVGTDLLPCCAFFLGCGEAKPASFAYLETIFAHINLAGRPCGLFSTNDDALEYLGLMVHDSEAAVGEPFLAQKDLLQNWVKGVLGN